jgi:hypothetical protein
MFFACAPPDKALLRSRLETAPPFFYDKDFVGATLKGKVRHAVDVYRKRENARRKSFAADGAVSHIIARAIGAGAPGGGGVRSFHVNYRCGRIRYSDTTVVSRKTLAYDLRGCRKLSRSP